MTRIADDFAAIHGAMTGHTSAVASPGADLFFPQWDRRRHIIKPFHIPPTWPVMQSFDWGFSSPSALLTWVISDGSPVDDLDGFIFPAGSLILTDEWYTGVNGQGAQLSNYDLGVGIGTRSWHMNISLCVADPCIFAKLSRLGSIYEGMQQGAASAKHKLTMVPAENNRHSGWSEMRRRLQNATSERPSEAGLWVFDWCENFIRTVPGLKSCPGNPYDIAQEQDDHCADAARFACAAGEQAELDRRAY